MALRPAGSAQQFISWKTAPTLSAKTGDVGVPGGTTAGWHLTNLYISNPLGKNVTITRDPSTPFPAGFSQGGTRNQVVNWNGSATPAARTSIRWTATQSNPSHSVSIVGWVEALAPEVALPVAPVNVTATAVSTSAIELAWTAGSGGSTPVKYRIYEALAAGGPWSDPYLAEDTASPYTRSGLPPNAQRWYYVTAVDANDAESGPSLADDATTHDDPLPHLVQNFAVALLDADTIRVSWAAPADGPTPTGYKVFRTTESGGLFAVIAANHPDSPYDDDVGAAATRYYKVAAMNGVNEGPPSEIKYATTPGVQQPATPINPAAAAQSSSMIRITWQPGPGGSTITQYRVYKATSAGGTWSTQGYVPAATVPLQFEHEGIAENQTRYYQVAAQDGTNESQPSPTVFATTHTVSPTVPTILSVVPLASSPQDTLKVTWVAGSGGSTPTKYNLFRAGSAGGSYAQVGGDITGTSYDNTGLTADTPYWYKVQAFDAQNDASGESAVVSGSTSPAAVLGTPVIDSAVALASSPHDTIRLTYHATAGVTPTGFRIYRSAQSGGTYSALNPSTPDTASPYDNTGLEPGATWYYRVSALDSATSAESDQSAYRVGTTSANAPDTTDPTVPTGLATSVQSASAINLTWNGSSDPTVAGQLRSGVAGYKVYRGATLLNPTSLVTVTTYLDSGLDPNTTYQYQVLARDVAGNESAKCTAVPGTTQAAPAGVWPANTLSTLPVVPGEAGFGMNTVAGSGRSGSVIGSAGNVGVKPNIRYVTNTAVSGNGSFRTVILQHNAGTFPPAGFGVDGATASGPSVVVFKTSGAMQCAGTQIEITRDKITIAGQTAPNPGFSMYGGEFFTRASDVCVTHLRGRYGDGAGPAGDQRDALEISGNAAGGRARIVIDHCSFSWSVDEFVTVWTNWDNVTISNCLLAEPLVNSIHPKGAHGYGPTFGHIDNAASDRISVYRTIIAHVTARAPLSRAEGLAWVNNMLFNVGGGAFLQGKDTGHTLPAVPTYNWIQGNHRLNGNNQPTANEIDKTVILTGGGAGTASLGLHPDTRIYLLDNIGPGMTTPPSDPWTSLLVGYRDGATASNTAAMRATSVPSYAAAPGLVTTSALNVRGFIVSTAGARPANRDSVDTRTCSQVTSGSGGRINSQGDVGGFPTLAVNAVDHTQGADPIPDGLSGRPNPHTIAASGYTLLEEWLHRKAAAVE